MSDEGPKTFHYKVVEGSDNPIANTAIVALTSLTSLGQDFVVVPPPKRKPETGGRPKIAARQYTTDAALRFRRD